MTNEGPKRIKQLIEWLKKAPTVKPLKWDDNLAKAAKDHIEDMGPSGATGHTGRDGSSFF